MTIPGAAKTEDDLDDGTDRDTVELDGSALTRLRELDPDVGGLDRDTVEITTAESLSLAKKAEGPLSSPLSSAPVSSAPRSSPSSSGEVEVPLVRRSLAEVEAEALDRTALHTIPSPPLFDEED